MIPDEADVVVVGSGAGGAPAALELSVAGARVVVLEKGRAAAPEELVHDELTMCRRDFFVPYVADEPHTLRSGEHETARPTADGWTSNIVGGGTVHYSGFLYRMKPVDFRPRSVLGHVEGAALADWPIDYHDLEPHYARAELELGVSGRWRQHPFEEPRSTDFPFPPLDEHPLAARIDEAARALGLHPFSTPRGILSRAHGDRGACLYCSVCGSFGCPAKAKASTSFSLLPRAIATGRCEVRARSMAIEVTVSRDGRVRGVVYLDEKGARRFIAARVVVLACTAIETARLLLASRSSRFPDGLANGSRLVGRNLIFSGSGAGAALFRRRGRPWLERPCSPFVHRSIQDLYHPAAPVDGVRKAGTLQFLLGHANPILNAERTLRAGGARPAWGQRLKDLLRERAGTLTLEFEVFSEFLPTAGTYVDLDPTVKDRFGLPVARMTVARHPLDARAAEVLIDRGMAILDALAPDEAERGGVGDTKFLQGGTCRFGADPAASVLDRDCRAHEVPNLYVTDGSFLPSSGGVPLTLTIAANAFRVAARVAERFRAGAL
ncbi:MAG TPA: GMC family oxidoreductase [Polyangia bacterium]|nr:GMC family oxidoreductase [Polyangia bacterium]